MPSRRTAEFAVVYPVEGTYLNGIPHRPTVTTPSVAERLLRTGAFRAEAPDAPGDGEPNPIDIFALEDTLELDALLDHYDPPDPPPAVAATPQPEGPAEDAGPSHSQPEV